jgi:hypothetical protein
MNKQRYLWGTYCFLAVFNVSVFAQSEDAVYFRARQDQIKYWSPKTFYRNDDNYAGILSRDEIIKGKAILIYGGNEVTAFYKDAIIIVKDDDIESIHTQDEFSTTLFINDNNENTVRWIFDHYLKALSKSDKNIIYQQEKEYLDSLIEEYRTEQRSTPWYELWYAGPLYRFYPNLEFRRNYVVISGYPVFVNRILKTDFGYIVTVLADKDFEKFTGIKEQKTITWPSTAQTKFFTLIFEFDGDYLTLYLENKETIFARFVLVDQVVFEQLDNLVHEGSGDWPNAYFEPSKIVSWPCRADGSMDYPPPQLAQAVPEQPVTVTIDTPPAKYEDAAGVTSTGETVARQPGIGLPLVIVLVALGIAVVAGVVVFLIRRKK